MLNWEIFATLPGSQQDNFEDLCRTIIHRNYGQYGLFAACAQQPGVEFHLKLKSKCPLGNPGRWYGWQCRWYGISNGQKLGSARRKKISESITTTEKFLPELTDWILWTKHILTKSDQEWFFKLKTKLQLHLWTSKDVEEQLSGDSEIYRNTYFGELILTPKALVDLHDRSIASIQQRWQPEVHQSIKAERDIRELLGESEYWKILLVLANDIRMELKQIDAEDSNLPQILKDNLYELIKLGENCANILCDSYNILSKCNFDQLHLEPSNPLLITNSEILNLPRHLRSIRHKLCFTVTNLLSKIKISRKQLKALFDAMSIHCIGVVAEAGCGKTELSAQITMSSIDRPAGILLHGRDLSAGDSLDDLARRIIIQGKPLLSMDQLVAALDAAGQRAHRRLPLIIDGLNESEDPRDWKALLASLNKILPLYPYVLLLCTVRNAFIQEALPDDFNKLWIPDFEEDVFEAIRRYFKHYRIDATDALIPIDLLRHPLTMRLFCEVTNPSRDHVVGIEAIPETLTGLFERYIDQSIKRISELSPRTHQFYAMDVRSAINKIGHLLWINKSRTLGVESLREELNDDKNLWGNSLVRALELNGILLRGDSHLRRIISATNNTPASMDFINSTSVSVVYDQLAGYIIANSLLIDMGQNGLEPWFKKRRTIDLFTGKHSSQHPLSSDIFQALVALTPRRLQKKQLWTILDDPLRTKALRQVADLEAAFIDNESINQLSQFTTDSPEDYWSLFSRLKQTRGSEHHPLNSEFLDNTLRRLSVSDRDKIWSEWIRHNTTNLIPDLERLEERWQRTMERNVSDELKAQWVSWLLTSTVRPLRDQATSSLYWYGRGDALGLFNLTLASLDINDAYVPERLLAASYGVVMVHSLFESKFAESLKPFLFGLYGALVGSKAHHPTNHLLMRLYVQGMGIFASRYYSNTIPDGMFENGDVPFILEPSIKPISIGDEREPEVRNTLHMDFENYTVGRLFSDRGNYDMKHAGHQKALAYIKGLIWNLGWRESNLGIIDRELMSGSERLNRAKIERYGKKYSWIGYYKYAGILSGKKGFIQNDERLSDVDIDPSFPERPPQLPFLISNWAQPIPKDDKVWLTKTKILTSGDFLYLENIDSVPGPWVAVHGFLETNKQPTGRRVFGLLSAMLVSKTDENRLKSTLLRYDHPGHFSLSEIPGAHYIFNGEIPWHPDFEFNYDDTPPSKQYYKELEIEGILPIEIELLAHRYSWESYHSSLNNAGATYVPSQVVSKTFDLRSIPQSFNQRLSDGSIAALSYSAPNGYTGDLLYLREDLLKHYANGRILIQYIWGEKELDPFPDPLPPWLSEIHQNYKDTWRHLKVLW